MKEQTITKQNVLTGIVRPTAVDILLLVVVYYLPALSHHLAFPLYMLDPMRIVIFTSILLSKNKYNSYIMAATIPLFSYFVGGHPVLLKSAIIGVELLVNITLFWMLLKKWQNVFITTFISIILAKAIYYASKFIFVEMGWLQMDLFSTPIYVQGLVALFISVVMHALFKK